MMLRMAAGRFLPVNTIEVFPFFVWGGTCQPLCYNKLSRCNKVTAHKSGAHNVAIVGLRFVVHTDSNLLCIAWQRRLTVIYLNTDCVNASQLQEQRSGLLSALTCCYLLYML